MNGKKIMMKELYLLCSNDNLIPLKCKIKTKKKKEKYDIYVETNQNG